ncbi:CARDB domain-containing protein [Aliikangiella sp. G2MR2-5]|uniref:CARDB domain-containing protein n=1 Tax=Aliikangiella sp. G2MR2-5 TaxID=2788943 RepID=UPI0018A8EB0C|nr:CARDB domain-containing protein [Aliikangiella sp. G2MR2-5]
MKKLVLASIAIAALFNISNSEAAAWRTCDGNKIKWGSNSKTFRASNVSFPSGSSYLSALQTVISRVNDNPSKFNFSLQTGDTSVGFDNGQNETWFTNDSAALDGAPAVAFTWSHCYWLFGWHYGIDEVDVLFNNNVAYTSSSNKSSSITYGGSFRPFRTTATHEFGHAMGLLHENRFYNIMGQDWDHIHANGNSTRAYLGEDAANGSVILYGTTTGTMEDVSLTHHKYLGTSGEYSTHQSTKLYTSTGGNLSSFVNSGERVYRVNKGQSVKLELTAENNGKSSQTPQIKYYISTNNIISTGDQNIGTGSLTLNRNTPYTFQRSLTIPSSLNSGQYYWIGAVIDSNNAIAETTGANNATYLRIYVN